MLTIGLTGGIGSGKTAASDYLNSLGAHIVDADIVAREVVEPGTPALAAIKEHFGVKILNESKSLDRSQLRNIIFNDPKEKEWLESLLHPVIRTEIKNQLDKHSAEYSVLVSPLLFETDQHKLVDRTLLIDVPEKLQLERASARDNSSIEQIQKILEAQSSRSYKLQLANDVIVNDKSIEFLQKQIEAIHQKYLELARERNA